MVSHHGQQAAGAPVKDETLICSGMLATPSEPNKAVKAAKCCATHRSYRSPTRFISSRRLFLTLPVPTSHASIALAQCVPP
jgi:hypothetical protein